MSSRWLSFLLALSLLLNAFVLAGFVWTTWIEPPRFVRQAMHPPPPPPAPGLRPGPLELLSQDLGLDDRQRDELKGLFDRYGEARRERYDDIQRIRDQMADELKAPGFDLARLDALVDQMTVLRVDQQKEYLRAFAELGPKLRPDQRERLHRLLADRYGGRNRVPPPSPQPPPQPTR